LQDAVGNLLKQQPYGLRWLKYSITSVRECVASSGPLNHISPGNSRTDRYTITEFQTDSTGERSTCFCLVV